MVRKIVFGYYSSWATYRTGAGKCDVDDIDPHLFTHLAYAFSGIDNSGRVKLLDPWLDLTDNGGRGNIQRFNGLKRINPSLKTLVSFGGHGQNSSMFPSVAASSSMRRTFARSAREFCQTHNFDGVDIDWEFPDVSDRENFVSLLAELANELRAYGLLLTIAVGGCETIASKGYNISAIASHVDYINLMTYDFNGSWNSFTGHNAPLYASSTDQNDYQRKLNVDSSVTYWLSQGAPASKLILGIPTYGRTFALASSSSTGVRAEARGAGEPGPWTKEAGSLAYYEVCEKLGSGWSRARDGVPYAYTGNQWISYDDGESVAEKCRYINSRSLGGAMVWTIDMDDFRGRYGTKYPLVKRINGLL